MSRLEKRLPTLLSVIAGIVGFIGFLTLGSNFTVRITGNLVVFAAVSALSSAALWPPRPFPFSVTGHGYFRSHSPAWQLRCGRRSLGVIVRCVSAIWRLRDLAQQEGLLLRSGARRPGTAEGLRRSGTDHLPLGADGPPLLPPLPQLATNRDIVPASA